MRSTAWRIERVRIVRALVKSGSELFVCDWVGTLALALERLAAGGIDVVLLDFGLPDSSGLESFSRLYGSAPNVAIIPLTGTGDDALALEAVRLGAQDYLFKGAINQAILTRSIRHAVERKRISEALRQARDSLGRQSGGRPDDQFETGQDLPDFIMQFARERAALGLLNLDEAMRERPQLLFARLRRGQQARVLDR